MIKNSSHKTGTNKKEKTPQQEENENFSIPGLSLFSENTFFEKFLENSNMTQQIQQTLKKINKTFSSKEFNDLNTDQKQEYLKKFLLKPLTESLSLPTDFFTSTNFNQDQLSQVQNHPNLNDYINFNIQPLNLQMNDNSQHQSEHLFDGDMFAGNTKSSLSLKLIDIEAQSSKAIFYKKDPIIEIDLYHFLEQMETVEDETDETYNKNIKEMSQGYHLHKFINKIKAIDDYSIINNKNYNSCFIVKNILTSNKEVDELMSQYRRSNHSQGSSNSNIFNDIVDVNLKISENGQGMEEEIINSLKIQFTNNKSQNGINFTLEYVPSERIVLQEAISELFSNYKNYQEISFETITSTVGKHIKEKHNEKNALVFYNMLIACQNNNISIHQTNFFESFYFET